MTPTKQISGVYEFADQGRVVFGQPFARAVADEIKRIGSKRVILFSTPALSGPQGLAHSLAEAMGCSCRAMVTDCEPHTPLKTVLRGAQIARNERADLIVSLGGSSVTDTAKAVQLMIWQNIEDATSFEAFRIRGFENTAASSPIRVLAVPTTYSGSEFTPYLSILDEHNRKYLLQHRQLVPHIAVLDPTALVTTPTGLLLSTGFKAIDHAVETLSSPTANPISDTVALRSLVLLFGALRSIKRDQSNLVALLDGQFGVWLSLMGVASGVLYGASHALGYTLSSQHSVAHGYTSCLTLPPVVRWNSDFCESAQNVAVSALQGHGKDLSALLTELLQEIELPHHFQDFRISKADFPRIAAESFHHKFMKANPRPVSSPDDVIDILELGS